MILFALILVILMIVGLCVLFAAGISGAIGIVLYGDIIVCMVLIVIILKKLIKRH